ncbi:MAG: immunoglobulin-like domain-containing protein [Bacteroidota bacterium]
MKRNFLNMAAVAFIASALVLTGCKKDEDTTAPVVTLNGASTQTISLQGTYTEQNATATDDEDGTLTPTTSGTVNKDQTGEYIITYTATDAAGNVGTATRTITVVNDADSRTGTYQCTIADTPPYVYTQTVTASETVNNRIHFSKFGDYDNNTAIYADIASTNITLPSQIASSVGTPAATRTFQGTGSTTTGGFTLNYTELTNGTTFTTAETFVKQ